MKERKADSKVSEIGAFSYFVHRNQTTVRITNPKNGVGSEIVLVYYIQKLDLLTGRSWTKIFVAHISRAVFEL